MNIFPAKVACYLEIERELVKDNPVKWDLTMHGRPCLGVAVSKDVPQIIIDPNL